MFDVQKFVSDLHDYIGKAFAPIVARVKALEDRPLPVAIKGDKGDSIKGDPGDDAPPVTDDQIAAAVSAYLKANPPPKGDKGDSVKGDKGDSVKGEPGMNAEVAYEDIIKAVREVHEQLIATHVLDIERRGWDAIQRAIDKLPAPKDGKDGLTIDDLVFDFDGQRTITAKFVRGGAVLKEMSWRFPVVLDRGYWKDGFKAVQGDAVTDCGTWWICVKDTAERPSLQAKDWRIGASKGKDGTSTIKAPAPTPGPVKLDGA